MNVPYYQVGVEPWMKERAELEEKILNEENSGANTRNMNDDRDYIGLIGEFSFGRFLDEKGLDPNTNYIYNAVKSMQRGDPYDYMIEGKRIDVMTAPRDLYFLVSAEKVRRVNEVLKKPLDFAVSVYFDEGSDKAYVRGWIEWDLIITYPLVYPGPDAFPKVKFPCYVIPKHHLKDCSLILPQSAKKEVGQMGLSQWT